MPEIKIIVDGVPGDDEDLYQRLRSVRFTSGTQISAISSDDGTLGLVDVIIASVGSFAALATVVMEIVKWKNLSTAKVRIDLGEGKSLTIENADQETIECLWNAVQKAEELGESK